MITLATEPMDTDDPDGIHDLAGTVVTDLEALRQRVVQRLRFRRGEWQLDLSAGTDSVIGHQTTVGLAAGVISDAIRDEGGSEVTEVHDVVATLDGETRVFRYSAVVETVYGQMTISGAAG